MEYLNYTSALHFSSFYNCNCGCKEWLYYKCVVFIDGSKIKIFMLDDKLHRINGPARVVYYKTCQIYKESYYINGVNHRKDGPANIYYENGKIKELDYIVNGKSHREDGPAYIEYYENGKVERETYYINNKGHRIDGPSSIYYDIDGNIVRKYYYINGEYIK